MSPNELQQLQPIAEALNAESNDINNTIAALNAKLSALNIGIEVWLGPWKDNPIQIGFGKYQESSWQLLTRECGEVRYERDNWGNESWVAVPERLGIDQPLLQASRIIRIEALRLLPEIIDDLKVKAERSLETIRAAKRITEEL
jgi:hypothetical protein